MPLPTRSPGAPLRSNPRFPRFSLGYSRSFRIIPAQLHTGRRLLTPPLERRSPVDCPCSPVALPRRTCHHRLAPSRLRERVPPSSRVLQPSYFPQPAPCSLIFLSPLAEIYRNYVQLSATAASGLTAPAPLCIGCWMLDVGCSMFRSLSPLSCPQRKNKTQV